MGVLEVGENEGKQTQNYSTSWWYEKFKKLGLHYPWWELWEMK